MTREELENDGWATEPRSFYDEEGVEGWVWLKDGEEKYWELGSWTEPAPIPEELIEAVYQKGKVSPSLLGNEEK